MIIFILSSFQEPLNLTKEDFWSTLKQETPPQAEIDGTQEINKQFSLKNGQELNMLYLQMDLNPNLPTAFKTDK